MEDHDISPPRTIAYGRPREDGALNGFYSIALTPFDSAGGILWEDLERECDWLAGSGAHGMVWPVNDSEFSVLSFSERLEGMRRVTAAAAKRVPVVLGVADVCLAGARELAAAAAAAGASAVIAMPPWNVKLAAPQQFADYYQAIAGAAGLPVVIQNLGEPRGSNLDAQTIRGLCERIPLVQYVKEERPGQAGRVSELAAMVGDGLKGVFSGGWVLNPAAAYRRGCCGLMQGSAIPDVMSRVWDLLVAGREEEARAIERNINVLEAVFFSAQTMQSVKETLVLRGLFRSSALRGGPPGALDAEWRRELDLALDGLRPWLRENPR